MNEHLLNDITNSNYCVRKDAAKNYLKANNIPHKIIELRNIFLMLVSGNDKPTDEDIKKHQEVRQLLIDYVNNYGKPIQYNLLS
jgi:hypothetical protein